MSLSLINGRPKGMLPACWSVLKSLVIPASRVVQTVGSAPASAGTHARDGWFINEHRLPEAYCAAFDLSVHTPYELSDSDVKQILSKFADRGIIGWKRDPNLPEDGWHQSLHIHCVFVGCKMKPSLRGQVRDWLLGLNGLVSHTPYHFTSSTSGQRAVVKSLFVTKNSKEALIANH